MWLCLCTSVGCQRVFSFVVLQQYLWWRPWRHSTRQETKGDEGPCYFVMIVTSTPTYLTYLLTAWGRVLLETLTVSQLVKKFPAFYRTRRFITAFKIAPHLSLFWASSFLSITPHYTSWRSKLILSSHLCLRLPSGLFPSGFPTETLYTPLPSPIRATCPAHLILDSTPT
jgi:hypothetical protein